MPEQRERIRGRGATLPRPPFRWLCLWDWPSNLGTLPAVTATGRVAVALMVLAGAAPLDNRQVRPAHFADPFAEPVAPDRVHPCLILADAALVVIEFVALVFLLAELAELVKDAQWMPFLTATRSMMPLRAADASCGLSSRLMSAYPFPICFTGSKPSPTRPMV